MKTKITILLFLLQAWRAFAAVEEIERILKLPESQINIGYVCLLLSKDAFPDYDIQSGTQTLDAMASRMREFLMRCPDDMTLPDNRIGAMNTFLFRAGPWNNTGTRNIVYEYDIQSTEKIQPPALFLAHALTTLKGTCSSLPMLWYSVADRLGWPVQAVRMPGHIFLRYKGAKHQNIDPSAYGGFIPDSQYVQDFQISNVALENGVYMRSLSKKEFISTLLVNNAYFAIEEKKDVALGRKYLSLAISIDSTNADAYSNLALIEQNRSLMAKATALGFSRGYSQSFLKKQQTSITNQKKGVTP